MAMASNCSKNVIKDEGVVKGKILCVFDCKVVKEPSTKRGYQPYKIEATEDVRNEAIISDIANARMTEKIDGTCVYIQHYRDIPWLWARHDRKPTKNAEKKFKKFQTSLRAWQVDGEMGDQPVFKWDMKSDFKDVPVDWCPATDLKDPQTNEAIPDDGGHIFGWVPIDPRGRNHLWHSSVVDLDAGLALVLKLVGKDGTKMEICPIPLTELMGKTLELIGTNVNANPYKIGSKKSPLHLLVEHGSIPAEKVVLTHQAFVDWFKAPQGQVEGVVWHCSDGNMFKLHRHHLNLHWPPEGITFLATRPVLLNVDIKVHDLEPDSSLYKFAKFHGREFSSLKDFSEVFTSTNEF